MLHIISNASKCSEPLWQRLQGNWRPCWDTEWIFFFPHPFVLCKISMLQHMYLAQDFQVQQQTQLAEKSLFFKDWRIKSCPTENAPQERSEAPPCHALPQEADCFLMVPFGILEEFFISFFTFSPGFLLSSAKHREGNSCSRTKESLIPTQWDLRVGLGSLLICDEMRTFVCSPNPPYYRQNYKLHKSHRLIHSCSAFGEHFGVCFCSRKSQWTSP